MSYRGFRNSRPGKNKNDENDKKKRKKKEDDDDDLRDILTSKQGAKTKKPNKSKLRAPRTRTGGESDQEGDGNWVGGKKKVRRKRNGEKVKKKGKRRTTKSAESNADEEVDGGPAHVFGSSIHRVTSHNYEEAEEDPVLGLVVTKPKRKIRKMKSREKGSQHKASIGSSNATDRFNDQEESRKPNSGTLSRKHNKIGKLSRASSMSMSLTDFGVSKLTTDEEEKQMPPSGVITFGRESKLRKNSRSGMLERKGTQEFEGRRGTD